MQLKITRINDKIVRSSKTNNIRTLNLLKKPARGGIPPTENKRIAKDKEIIIFHFLRKDQLIKYLNKKTRELKPISNENKPRFIII
jgi:hypothetical protein